MTRRTPQFLMPLSKVASSVRRPVWRGCALWWQERWVMRGCGGGAGREEGMIGALRGIGSGSRKRRRVWWCNEAAHLYPPPPHPIRPSKRWSPWGGLAESRGTTPAVICSSKGAHLMWSLYLFCIVTSSTYLTFHNNGFHFYTRGVI